MTKETVKNIPLGMGYAEPEIMENVETVQYYEVNGEKFFDRTVALRKAKRLNAEMSEHTDDVIVYSVGDERFLDLAKAEQRCKRLKKDYRDDVRNTVRVYGIDKASQANALPHMVWLLTHYSFDQLTHANFFWAFNKDREDLVRKVLSDYAQRCTNKFLDSQNLSDPADTSLPLEHFFEDELYQWLLNCMTPYRALVVFHADSDIANINFPINRNIFGEKQLKTWSWLEPYEELNGCFRVPVRYGFKLGTPAFRAWIEENDTLHNKVNKVVELINYRVGELLYLEALALTTIDEDNVMTVPSLDDALSNIPCNLILEELRQIIEFIDGNENGTNFHIAVQKGAPVYWLNDDKRSLSPFKQF